MSGISFSCLRRIAFAAAFAAAFAGGAYAAKKFSDLSTDEMRKTFEDANLADDCYIDDVSVRDGYKPSGTFLNSSDINVKSRQPDGSAIFTFLNDPVEGAKCSTPCAYVYNAKNGMITPLTGDAAKSVGCNPKPPNFAAQVLEKDGATHIAFRGSDLSLADMNINKSDWVDTNAMQALGAIPPQYTIADTITKSVQDTTSGPVRLTGHSEGAAEVQWSTLQSISRGNTDISGTAFNYAQLSKDVKAFFPKEVQDAAGARIGYFRVGNDIVSGGAKLGDGPLSEEYDLGDANWKGTGPAGGLVTYLDKEDWGEAHKMTTVIDHIMEGIGEKIKDERKANKEAEADGGDNSSGNKGGGYSLRDGEDQADPAGETGKGFPQKAEGNNFFTDVQKDRDDATTAANNLNTIVTGEREQESKNEIAQEAADQTLNAGGEIANQTLNDTAANTANEQDKNSWTTAISDGIQQSINIGVTSLGTSFGNELGKHVANEIFDDPDKPKGGAKGGAKGGTVAKGGGKGKDKGKGEGEGEGKGEGDPEVAGDPGHGKGKDPGKSGDGGKQPNADTAGNCKRCGVSFSKVPEASDADDKFTTSTVGISCKGYCVICLNDEIGSSKWTKVYSEEELKDREDPMQCTRCKRYISLSTTADERSDDPVHGAGTQWSGKMLCHSCVADLWREKTGVAKTTAGDSSSDGKINGTYSSSSGPANKTDMGAYTCAWCGKKTNSIVSGVGSGVYCSNACYQKFLDSRKQSQGLSVRSRDAYKEDPSEKMRELPKDRQFRDALLPAPDSKNKL